MSEKLIIIADPHQKELLKAIVQRNLQDDEVAIVEADSTQEAEQLLLNGLAQNKQILLFLAERLKNNNGLTSAVLASKFDRNQQIQIHGLSHQVGPEFQRAISNPIIGMFRPKVIEDIIKVF